MKRTLHSRTADVYTVDELVVKVGSVDRSVALKALMTWVDMGVLREDGGNRFKLLEVAEGGTNAKITSSRPGGLDTLYPNIRSLTEICASPSADHGGSSGSLVCPTTTG